MIETSKLKIEKFFRKDILTNPEFENLKIAWSKTQNEEGLYELYLLTTDDYLDGSYVSKSVAQRNKNTEAIEVMIIFSEDGTKLWESITKENIGQTLAIVLDGEVYSSPKIMDKISSGKAMISGNFSEDEAIDLAVLLKHGELPLQFNIIE